MLNYEEIVTQANARHTQRLAQAEQQRLVQALATPQSRDCARRVTHELAVVWEWRPGGLVRPEQ